MKVPTGLQGTGIFHLGSRTFFPQSYFPDWKHRTIPPTKISHISSKFTVCLPDELNLEIRKGRCISHFPPPTHRQINTFSNFRSHQPTALQLSTFIVLHVQVVTFFELHNLQSASLGFVASMADPVSPFAGFTSQDQKLIMGALKSLKNGFEVSLSCTSLMIELKQSTILWCFVFRRV